MEATMFPNLFDTRVGGRAAAAVATIRILVGLFFIVASLPKFPFTGEAHAHEVSEFVRFGFPPSELLVGLVGIVELASGVLLVLGLGTRLAAAALAVVMIGAISTAGVLVGGWFHLGVAPAMFVVMVVLLYAGPGAAAIDKRFAR